MSRNGGGPALKSKRQQAILSLVASERLASQEEIRARLEYLGLKATQSTISRDIEELGLARVHDQGGLRYVVPGEGSAPAPIRLLKHALEEFALSFIPTDSVLVIHTPAGSASALAEALDRVSLAEAAGTVAGDNTIFVVPREGSAARDVQRALTRVMEAT